MLDIVEPVGHQPIRVAVAHYNRQGTSRLGRIIANRGLNVVLNAEISPSLLSQLDEKSADVLLLDLDTGELPGEEDHLDFLLDKLDLPIVFSDSDVTMKKNQTDEELGHRLANKLSSLFKLKEDVSKGSRKIERSSSIGRLSKLISGQSVAPPNSRESMPLTPETLQFARLIHNSPARNVWILSGLMGGFNAIKRFLNLIPADLPVAFIVVLHVRPEITSSLVRLLSKSTAFNVIPAEAGHVLRHQQVVVAPADECIKIDEQGGIDFIPPAMFGEHSCKTSHIIRVISKHYEANAGAIIFSGIGRSGVDGCRSIVDQGGLVWTQDVASSRFSSMPEYVRNSCKVSYTATPEKLATNLIKLIAEQDHSKITNLIQQ